METELNAYPRWIAKMYPGKTGRDHLGLGSVSSDQILPTLSPSINVLTFHPRYHSFYIFLLDEYWKIELPRNSAAWKAFFRPREFVFSVGAYLCQQPEHGEMGNIVGGRKTEPLAAQEMETYNNVTEYIVSPLGGYGLYYRTVMAELGLLHPGGQGLPYPVDVPSNPLGKDLASSFRQAVQDTEYYKKYFSEDIIDIPIDVIREYIHNACLCQLKTQTAPDRDLLRKVFLEGGAKEAAIYRRFSIRLFLDIAKQTSSDPLDEDTFRQLLYFRETQSGIEYQPLEDLNLIHKQWKLYQAREYYALALNALWVHLSDWGINNNGERVALPFSALWEYITDSLNFDFISIKLNLERPELTPESRMSELYTWIQGVVHASAENFDNECVINSPLDEHLLYQLISQNLTDRRLVLPGMLVVLALIYLRFGDRELWQQPEWDIAKMGANGRLSVDGFVRQTKKMSSAGSSIFEYTKYIFEKYIIQQHIVVATRKLPDNTFRFCREGNKLRFFQHYNSLSFMNSRFDSISTTVFELGFCGDLHLPNHRLTDDGEEFLSRGEK